MHWPKFRMDWLTFTLALVISTVVLSVIPAPIAIVFLTHRLKVLASLSNQPMLKVGYAALHSLFFAITAGLRRRRKKVCDKHLQKIFNELLASDLRTTLLTDAQKQLLQDFWMDGVNTERFVFHKWFQRLY